MEFRIIALTSDRADLIAGAATLLHDTFRGRSEDWQDLASARQEVLDSLEEERISRVALDDTDAVVGWIGGVPSYAGRVWEIHPLVVRADCQRRGIGRALVTDLETMVRARGGLTLWVGSDDENNETSLSGIDLYADIPGAIASVKTAGAHPYPFYVRLGFRIAGVVPDANGPGKPDILLAKRVNRRR